MDDAVDGEVHDGGGQERVREQPRSFPQALVSHSPAAFGALDDDGRSVFTNECYDDLVRRGLTVPRQAPAEREVLLDDSAYLALRFPVPPAVDGEEPLTGEVLFDISAPRIVAMSAAVNELNQLKSDLVATVNHELRTPLSNILGYVELLADRTELDDEARAMLDVIDRNSHRLVTLVNDLLMIARIDNQTADDPPVALAPSALLEAAAATVSADAARLGLGLEVHDDCPGTVLHGERQQLERAVGHLARNAVTFSGSGVITLRCARDGDDVVLEVSDQGQGIDPEELPYLTERFARGRAVRRAQVQGVGLGLSLVSAVAERHGGDFELESALGRGTTARLRLPLEPAGPRA